MSANTKIEWAHHTFNPWVGCTKIGSGCDNCYAHDWDHRYGGDHWGAGKPRRRTTVHNWNDPRRWNRAAERLGIRYRVFCASLADVFDNEVPEEWRADLWALIRETPYLDWILVTKRIGNVPKMLPPDWGDGYPNVWLLITVVNQKEANRDIPKLLQMLARVRGLSMEPLMGPIDASPWLGRYCPQCRRFGEQGDTCRTCGELTFSDKGIDWAIVGGESGQKARPFVLGWGKDLVRQCKAAGVPVFVKQVGSNPMNREGERCLHIKDRKGGDPSEWPEELQSREYPIDAVVVRNL